MRWNSLTADHSGGHVFIDLESTFYASFWYALTFIQLHFTPFSVPNSREYLQLRECAYPGRTLSRVRGRPLSPLTPPYVRFRIRRFK